MDEKAKIEILKHKLKDLERKAREHDKSSAHSAKVHKTVDKHKQDIKDLKTKLNKISKKRTVKRRAPRVNLSPVKNLSEDVESLRDVIGEMKQNLAQLPPALNGHNQQVMEKLQQILEQNEKIAQGVLTVADMIRDKFEIDVDSADTVESEPAPFGTFQPIGSSPPMTQVNQPTDFSTNPPGYPPLNAPLNPGEPTDNQTPGFAPAVPVPNMNLPENAPSMETTPPMGGIEPGAPPLPSTEQAPPIPSMEKAPPMGGIEPGAPPLPSMETAPPMGGIEPGAPPLPSMEQAPPNMDSPAPPMAPPFGGHEGDLFGSQSQPSQFTVEKEKPDTIEPITPSGDPFNAPPSPDMQPIQPNTAPMPPPATQEDRKLQLKPFDSQQS